ncbi:MAG: tRNA (adenosine(37)-N6)-threonylcarbamoyltransferase complex transferase subunit TsaD [Dehalococcoidia bacterium]|jgi:N6-L-threonylcarbamoyladenine synthase
MKILGIESSCDESAAAVVEDGRHIVSSVIASQVSLHARYGGVVPEMASRKHLENLLPVVEAAMSEAGSGWSDLAAIAVTVGPGLSGSLLVGLNTAKAIAFASGLPLVGVSHLEAHIYANWLDVDDPGRAPPQFPLLALIVSGGHTDLLVMSDHGRYRLLGRTRDDAAGEAFDKVARLLDLGFPGGPAVEKAAAGVTAEARRRWRLPRALLSGSYDFSFSGLKTAVLRLVHERGEEDLPRAEIAAAFQDAVVDVLVAKTVHAARDERVAEIVVSGGVAANGALRDALRRRAPVPIHLPPPILCTDNAAMVAACGYFRFQRGDRAGLEQDVLSGFGLPQS